MTVLFSTIVVIWFLNYYFKFFNFWLLFLTNSKILSVMYLLYCHQALGCHWDFFPRKNKNKKQPHHNTTGFKKDRYRCVLSYVWLCDPMGCSPPGSPVHWIFQAKNTEVSCYFLLQGIFPTQGLNPSFLHWRADSWPLRHEIWKPIFVWGSRICVLTKLGEDGVTFCTTAFLYFTLRFCIAGTGENRGWSCSHIVTCRQSYLGTHGKVISPLISDVWTEYDERHENRSK